MFSAIINATFISLLVLSNVQSHSLPYRQPYINYGSLDESPVNRNNDADAPIPLPTNFKWYYNEDVRREPRQPLNRINYEMSDGIFFPSTNQGISPRIRTTPSCVGKTFCEEVADYPSHLADEIIKNNPQLRNYQNVDVVDSISLRVDVPSTTSLCPSFERVVYLKSAENANKEWMYILNNSNFTQGVRIETCMNEDGSCRIVDGLTNGYVTSCKQKYIFRQLVAITQDGSAVKDVFRIPASCCCHIEFVGDLSGRVNTADEPESRQISANTD